MSVAPKTTPLDLAVEVTTDTAGTARLAATGEIDVTTSAALRTLLDDVLDGRPAAVVVDLSGVTFLDSTGLSTLIHAYSRAEQQHTRLTVAGAQPIVSRLLHVTGLYELLCEPGPR